MASSMRPHIGIFFACSLIAFSAVVSAQPSLAPQPFDNGPSSAPEPAANDCFTNLVNMSDCLSYVTAGSNLTKPEKPCCPELAGLVESSPICLCQLLGQSDTFGVKIDLNRALKLPSVCKVSTPPVQTCATIGIPVGAPLSSAGPMSPDAHSPGGVATGPSTGSSNDNGASSNAGSVLAVTLGFAIAFLI